MKKDIITTNLRIPRSDWLQLRAVAAEVGLSVNEYIKRLIEQTSIKRVLAFGPKKRGEEPLWKLATLVNKKTKGKNLSADDRIIYEHNQ